MSTAALPAPTARRGAAALVWHQIRYEQLSFWRNRQSAIFTFAFPVVFVVVLGALLHGIQPSSYFYGLSPLQYYVPTIGALSVLAACCGQPAMVLATRRQNGILKQARATPLPAWAYLAGLLASCVVVSLIDVALIIGVGHLFQMPLPSGWPAILLTLVTGAACLCGLGVAVASVIRNAEAAPAVTQVVLFPLFFLSGTYMPVHGAALTRVTGFLPVRPFNQALFHAFAQHPGVDWSALGILAAWGVAGALVALRRFRWLPGPQ
jgi:ABC-2 type transport system permease protein